MYDVIVIGAGAAGVGMGAALRTLGLDAARLLIVDRERVGASFDKWPAEMRFISPSFTSNPFGLVDLNAITPDTSPAYTLRREHPSGAEYAHYLRAVAAHFELPVRDGVTVSSVNRTSGGFVLDTNAGLLYARYVVWAAGEFQHPRLDSVRGGALCLHNSQVRSWKTVADTGKDFVVIGGYESGIDAAVNLSAQGRNVRVLSGGAPWERGDSDPSVALSPYTHERLRRAMRDGRIDLQAGAHVVEVARDGKRYAVRLDSGDWLSCATRPILATGFNTSARQIDKCFAWRDDGMPELSDVDESTVTPGLFLSGPSVRQGSHIFCFIYKFRQRFAVVAQTIGTRLGIDTAPLKAYRDAGMFLDDLSCCGSGCAC